MGLLLLLIPAADFYRQSRAAALLYVALLAFSMPVLHNLKWGQVSTLMTGCVFAALYLNARGRWRGAAVVLGFAAAIKYYVAVFAGFILSGGRGAFCSCWPWWSPSAGWCCPCRCWDRAGVWRSIKR